MGHFAQMAGIEPKEPETESGSRPLDQRSKAELLDLIVRLTEMTAQQARIIGELRRQNLKPEGQQ